MAQADAAYMTFLAQHRTSLHSTNPIERVNGEVKRRTDVMGMGPGLMSSIAVKPVSCMALTDTNPRSGILPVVAEAGIILPSPAPKPKRRHPRVRLVPK